MSTSTDGYLFKHVFELEFDGYLITSDLQMSSTNVTILEVARPAGVHFIDHQKPASVCFFSILSSMSLRINFSMKRSRARRCRAGHLELIFP